MSENCYNVSKRPEDVWGGSRGRVWWWNLPGSDPFCPRGADAADAAAAVVVLFGPFSNFPNSFKIKTSPVSSNTTGQPFKTFSLHVVAVSKFLVTVWSCFSSCPSLVWRFWFWLCRAAHIWQKMALTFLVASRANTSTISGCGTENKAKTQYQ